MSRQVFRKILLMVAIVAGSGPASAQKHFLHNDTSLYRFFEALQQADKEVVSILHLGDSHVQAGFLPEAAAGRFKAKFGSAGTGWAFPYHLAGTNGPDTYKWSSPVRWEGDRVVDRYQSGFPGPGGILIKTQAPNPALVLTTKEPFNDITYWYADPSSSMQTGFVRMEAGDTTAVRLEPAGKIFYGTVVKNGHPGILYHGIGVNGAQLMHFNKDEATLSTLMNELHPKLVILSFGTNEAFGGVSAVPFRQEMEKAVERIRNVLPDACILFTTPPSGMLKKQQIPYRRKGSRKTHYHLRYVKHPQVEVIRAEMIRYCREKGLAYWDFHEAMKADRRFAHGWSTDHVHFNANGYTLQGTLLYEAVAAAFETYQHITR